MSSICIGQKYFFIIILSVYATNSGCSVFFSFFRIKHFKLISHPDIAYKITSLDTLLSRLHHWRAVGSSVVFTNGCFDILHRGHVELLATCRTFGDYVVVGLNSDASVRNLKGDTRPINDVYARAAVLASLSAVDAVVIFDEETPLSLITQIKPNVLVKGGDYVESNIAGAKEVRSYGGAVHIVPVVVGYSTSAIITQLKH